MTKITTKRRHPPRRATCLLERNRRSASALDLPMSPSMYSGGEASKLGRGGSSRHRRSNGRCDALADRPLAFGSLGPSSAIMESRLMLVEEELRPGGMVAA